MDTEFRCTRKGDKQKGIQLISESYLYSFCGFPVQQSHWQILNFEGSRPLTPSCLYTHTELCATGQKLVSRSTNRISQKPSVG